MARYVIIETRDSFDSVGAGRMLDVARGLAADGHQVTVFLAQNGVFPARRSQRSGELERLADDGVELLADDFSLRERAIGAERLARGVRTATVDELVDRIAEPGVRAMWH